MPLSTKAANELEHGAGARGLSKRQVLTELSTTAVTRWCRIKFVGHWKLTDVSTPYQCERERHTMAQHWRQPRQRQTAVIATGADNGHAAYVVGWVLSTVTTVAALSLLWLFHI